MARGGAAVCASTRAGGAVGDEADENAARLARAAAAAPGMVRVEVHEGSADGALEVRTWWRSAADFEAWQAQVQAPAEASTLGVVLASSDIAASRLSKAALAQYRGEPSSRPIYVGLRGNVYDVSESAGFYGPGGPYHAFAGRDATVALAQGLLTDEAVLGSQDTDVSSLSGLELAKVDEWVARFESKYPRVAVLADARSGEHALPPDETGDTAAPTRPPPKRQPRVYTKRVPIQKPPTRSKM